MAEWPSRRSKEAAMGCGQSASGADLLNCSPQCLVMRKSITAHAQGHLSTEELPKFTVTADEFFGKSCSINTGRVQGGGAAVMSNDMNCNNIYTVVI